MLLGDINSFKLAIFKKQKLNKVLLPSPYLPKGMWIGKAACERELSPYYNKDYVWEREGNLAKSLS